MSPMLITSSPGLGETGIQRPSRGQQLEPRFLGAEQQGDRVDVLVRAGADMLAGRLASAAGNGAREAPNCRRAPRPRNNSRRSSR